MTESLELSLSSFAAGETFGAGEHSTLGDTLESVLDLVARGDAFFQSPLLDQRKPVAAQASLGNAAS